MPGRFPLVLLSPGFSMPRSTLTTLADDLASRGCVVAAVDHAYEAVGRAFPGGRVLTCLACEQVATDQERAQVAVGRARDLSFVLDRLTTLRTTSGTLHGRSALPFGRMIDFRRIAPAAWLRTLGLNPDPMSEDIHLLGSAATGYRPADRGTGAQPLHARRPRLPVRAESALPARVRRPRWPTAPTRPVSRRGTSWRARHLRPGQWSCPSP
ncbi:hypothetical protein C6N75_04530 [Streptomyces solincola]|uniref:Uncharacterized protein n=1 Tax=Streptomyces solincola TaxID=2100817 RepID=A0A2S9Q1A6_9ACTN|nr:hypothetical protein C6N75_04530 [Streptomyces solincola]